MMNPRQASEMTDLVDLSSRVGMSPRDQREIHDLVQEPHGEVIPLTPEEWREAMLSTVVDEERFSELDD